MAHDQPKSNLSRTLARSSPSWLASLLLHMLLLILFGSWLLPELPALVTADLNVSTSEPDVELEEIAEVSIDSLQLEEQIDFRAQPDTTLVEDEISLSPTEDLEASPAAEVALLDIGSEMAPLLTAADAVGPGSSGLAGRGHMARTALVRKGGGNEASETAVTMALEWLANHQNPDGTWSFDHQQGACQGRCDDAGTLHDAYAGGTALALLPFLGAGQTHTAGDYQGVVARGLAALVRQMDIKPGKGGSFVDSGAMYSHGLASIALCEAYAMTDDPSLQRPAQLAIDFIVYAQDPRGGGWRYAPRQPGDTSVVGWQVMALKSGHMGFLRVPASTVRRASSFLDYIQVDGGSGYGYIHDEETGELKYRPSTSAIGLLCRMYLGASRDNPTLVEGIRRISESGPSETDFYYNYYAAQLLFQFTGGEGPVWDAWNNKLRDQLVNTQDTDDHAKGSWVTEAGHGMEKGGRLYCTAMGCMTLEVYYRHMPIYRTDSIEVEFPE